MDKNKQNKIDSLYMVFGITCLLVVGVLLIYWLNFRGGSISPEVGNWGGIWRLCWGNN